MPASSWHEIFPDKVEETAKRTFEKEPLRFHDRGDLKHFLREKHVLSLIKKHRISRIKNLFFSKYFVSGLRLFFVNNNLKL